MEVINDASTYFKERAGDLDYEKEPDSESWAKTVTVQKSEEKGKKKLEECLPILVVGVLCISSYLEDLRASESASPRPRRTRATVFTRELKAECSSLSVTR